MQNQIVKIKRICEFSIPVVGNEITNLNVTAKIQTKRLCPTAAETMNQTVFYDTKLLHRNSDYWGDWTPKKSLHNITCPHTAKA